MLTTASATVTNSGQPGAVFVPIVPCRIIDTRPTSPVGARTTPLSAGETMELQATGTVGNCTIPASAQGLAMNVTAVNGNAPSFLTLWPTGTSMPTASNLNWMPGAPPTPNKVDVKLGGGKVNIYNYDGTVDVVADVVGFYDDHHHDDRYYTKGQADGRYYTKGQIDANVPNTGGVETINISPFGGVFESPAQAEPYSSCLKPTEPVAHYKLPINFPQGSKLMSISFRATGYLDARVWDTDPSHWLPLGSADVVSGTATRTMAFDQIIPADRGLVLRISFYHSTAELCAVSVTYDRTP